MKLEELLHRTSDARSRLVFLMLALIVFLAAWSSAAIAQQVQVTLDPAQTKINISVHDVHGGVHGSFPMKSGAVSFEPSTGAARGEIVIDATSGDTGNGSRDRKMKKEVLETQRYPEITFTPHRVLGQWAPQGTSNLQVEGVFHIHGVDHNLTLSLPVVVSGDKITGSTSFDVPYESWGMKNPSMLFLRVDGTAQISLSFAGRIALSNAAGAH
jgi:polyisoprenoid-binding protein YceI